MSKQASFAPNEPEITNKGKRRKKPRPIIVWWRSTRGGLFRDWCRFGRYETEEIARNVIAKKKGDLFEYVVTGTKPSS